MRARWGGVDFGDENAEAQAWVRVRRFLEEEIIPTLRPQSPGRRSFEDVAAGLAERFPPGPRSLSPHASGDASHPGAA